MLFKITHIDAAGHCHRAHVTARNAAEAMDLADRQWGEAQRLACLRLQPKPQLVDQHRNPNLPRRAPCVF